MDLGSNFTIQYRLTKSDIYRACLQGMIRTRWFMGFVPLVGLASIAIALSDSERYGELIYSGVTCIAIGVLYFMGIPYSLSRSAMKDPNFAGKLTASFSQSGIESAGGFANGMLQWPMITGATETWDFILVHLHQGGAFMLPKKQLTDGEVAALRDVLRTYSPGKVKLRSR